MCLFVFYTWAPHDKQWKTIFELNRSITYASFYLFVKLVDIIGEKENNQGNAYSWYEYH